MSGAHDTESRLGIEALGLSNRSKNLLRRHGIETVQQLLSRPLRQLQKLEGFGDRATWEICGALRRLGFSLSPEPVSGAKPSKASVAYLERLRDEFAAQAMQPLIAGRDWRHFKGTDEELIAQWAESSYALADAMLRARSK